MRKFMRDPRAATAPGSGLLGELIHGWGNKAWSAREEYASACVSEALRTDGPIVECGSGLTTIVLGAIAQKRGTSVWSLEHKPEWAHRVSAVLRKFQIDRVRLSARPLRRYPTFDWYDPPLESMPRTFGLVVCDGPPGRTRGGRSGLTDVMRDRIGSGTVILLDDAARRGERKIAKRWAAELPAGCERRRTRKPYFRIVVGAGRNA